jgi:hypothetical protein
MPRESRSLKAADILGDAWVDEDDGYAWDPDCLFSRRADQSARFGIASARRMAVRFRRVADHGFGLRRA